MVSATPVAALMAGALPQLATNLFASVTWLTRSPPTGITAQQAALLAQVGSVYEQLDDLQRMRIFASLVVIATALAFLVLFALAAGRVTRWYVNRRPRATKLQGDPFPRVIDSKPRPGKREMQNWQKR